VAVLTWHWGGGGRSRGREHDDDAGVVGEAAGKGTLEVPIAFDPLVALQGAEIVEVVGEDEGLQLRVNSLAVGILKLRTSTSLSNGK
jgi:hypothetical protein